MKKALLVLLVLFGVQSAQASIAQVVLRIARATGVMAFSMLPTIIPAFSLTMTKEVGEKIVDSAIGKREPYKTMTDFCFDVGATGVFGTLALVSAGPIARGVVVGSGFARKEIKPVVRNVAKIARNICTAAKKIKWS